MKPRILVLTRYYLPGYLSGGPVRSIANLVDQLGDEFEWQILTSNHDMGVPQPYPGVSSDAWTDFGKVKIYYASRTGGSPLRLLRVIRETPHDVLYLNSFFDPSFAILPALASWLRMIPPKPLLIAPRGEFSGGAYDIKAWKKRPYVVMARLAGVYGCINWHASTELESRDIMRVLGVSGSRIHAACDLAALSNGNGEGEARKATDDALRVCFLSRISRMKNLDYALRLLAKVRGKIYFRVYGPKEDPEYWTECELLAAGLPPNVRMTYEGAVPGDQVGAVFARNDLLFLPTRGENFGHVFVESWAAGTPVLTSDQTPWRGLAGEGVGWDLGLEDEQGFINALEEATGWDEARRAEVGQRSRAFAERYARDDSTVEDNRRMFLRVAGSGTRP